jgi:hypothetical protein
MAAPLLYDGLIEWREVESSNVRRVGWVKGNRKGMFIQYKSGDIYCYPDATRQQAVAVAHAAKLTKRGSVGSYVNRIKKHYRALKVVLR